MSIIRSQIYTSVIEDKPIGAITIHLRGEKLTQFKLSDEELLDLRAMVNETLREIRKRKKAQQIAG